MVNLKGGAEGPKKSGKISWSKSHLHVSFIYKFPKIKQLWGGPWPCMLVMWLMAGFTARFLQFQIPFNGIVNLVS
jgi:hypothetical protein